MARWWRPVSWRATWRTLHRAEVQTDLVQVAKVVLAAVLAWLVATTWLDSRQSFLAPWVAMLTVHATLARTLRSAAQTAVASLAGVVLAYVAAALLGFGTATLAAALLAGMLLSRVRALRDEGVTAATTALFVLTTAFEGQDVMLRDRLVETLAGLAIGVTVNLLVLPPLDDLLAQGQVDDVRRRLADLLAQMSHDLSRPDEQDRPHDWVGRTQELEDGLQRAEELLRWTTEAQAWNPRRRRSARAVDAARVSRELSVLDVAVLHTRSLARSVDGAAIGVSEWDGRFLATWTDLLGDVATAMREATDEGVPSQAELDRRTADLARTLSDQDLPGLTWTLYGALLESTRLLVTGVVVPGGEE